ncbi:MAG TPA: hypothetical protein VGZ00_01160 [Candidatus Baltobacteraceae bacterium]|nr:hypothetical protein [Candidatus Baltobacteraceae bacterium]
MLKDTPLSLTEHVPDDLIDTLVEKAGITKIEMHADGVLGGPPVLHTCTMVHFGKVPGDIAQFQTSEPSDKHDRAMLSAFKRASEAPEYAQPFLVVRILSEISDNFQLPVGAEADESHLVQSILGYEKRHRIPIIALIFADSKTLKERGKMGILELQPKPGEKYSQMLETILSTAKSEPPITIADEVLYSDTTILARGANAFTRKVAASLNHEEEFIAWAEGLRELRWHDVNYAMPGLLPRHWTSCGEDLQQKPGGRRSQA